MSMKPCVQMTDGGTRWFHTFSFSTYFFSLFKFFDPGPCGFVLFATLFFYFCRMKFCYLSHFHCFSIQQSLSFSPFFIHFEDYLFELMESCWCKSMQSLIANSVGGMCVKMGNESEPIFSTRAVQLLTELLGLAQC